MTWGAQKNITAQPDHGEHLATAVDAHWIRQRHNWPAACVVVDDADEQKACSTPQGTPDGQSS